jgi:hypothetical protein
MDDLKASARAAYERSRWGTALKTAAWLIPVVALGVALGEVWRELPIGVALVGLTVWMAWHGRSPGRAVLPGLMGGALAFVLPLTARFAGVVSLGCGATFGCIGTAVAGGLGAGVLVALVAKGRFAVVAWALLLAGGMAALSCLPLGGSALIAAGISASLAAPVVRILRPVLSPA